MTCPICRNYDTQPGTTTVTLERGDLTFVVKDVPAQVCANCGEDYVDADVTRLIMAMAEDAAAARCTTAASPRDGHCRGAASIRVHSTSPRCSL